jgi:uncharacterized protein YacL (UPF0231 family)
MFTDTHYEYKGFEYRTWDDREEDNIKTFHECWKDGKEVKMPYAFYNTSPYSFVEREDFVAFVQQIELTEFVKG